MTRLNAENVSTAMKRKVRTHDIKLNPSAHDAQIPNAEAECRDRQHRNEKERGPTTSEYLSHECVSVAVSRSVIATSIKDMPRHAITLTVLTAKVTAQVTACGR